MEWLLVALIVAVTVSILVLLVGMGVAVYRTRRERGARLMDRGDLSTD